MAKTQKFSNMAEIIKVELKCDLFSFSVDGIEAGDYKAGEVIECAQIVADYLIANGKATPCDKTYKPVNKVEINLTYKQQIEQGVPKEQFAPRAENMGELFSTKSDNMDKQSIANKLLAYCDEKQTDNLTHVWIMPAQLKDILGEDKFSKLSGNLRNGASLIPFRQSDHVLIAAMKDKKTAEEFLELGNV